MNSVRRSQFDSNVCTSSIHSLVECAELIYQTFLSIPDDVWMNYSRRSVRPDQHTHADQILLGLYAGVQSRGRLQFTKNTFRFPNLTRLMMRTIQLLPQLQEFECTSIQINRNLRTIPHRDSNNRGYSIGWALGNWTGGELFLHDQYGTDQLVITDPMCRVAGVGDVLRGRRLDVRHPVCFDSNTIHATLPFQGSRYLMVFFCVKRNIPVSPSSPCLSLARFLGFRVPVLSSPLSSLAPSPALLPLPCLPSGSSSGFSSSPPGLFSPSLVSPSLPSSLVSSSARSLVSSLFSVFSCSSSVLRSPSPLSASPRCGSLSSCPPFSPLSLSSPLPDQALLSGSDVADSTSDQEFMLDAQKTAVLLSMLNAWLRPSFSCFFMLLVLRVLAYSCEVRRLPWRRSSVCPTCQCQIAFSA